MTNFEGDARYLAHLWNTLIDNNYLTREFITVHPEIIEDAHNASGRILEAAQQSVHPTVATVAAQEGNLDYLSSKGNRMKTQEKYMNDPEYNHLVKTLEMMIEQARFTPSELREAVILACTNYEMRHVREMQIDPRTDEAFVSMPRKRGG